MNDRIAEDCRHLSVAEAATYIGVSHMTLRRAMERKINPLPFVMRMKKWETRKGEVRRKVRMIHIRSVIAAAHRKAKGLDV